MAKKQEKIKETEESKSPKKQNIVKKQKSATKIKTEKLKTEKQITKNSKIVAEPVQKLESEKIVKTPKNKIYRDYGEFNDWDEEELDIFFDSDYHNIMKSIKKNDLDSSSPY